MKYYGRDRGSAIMGTTGTVVVDRDGYEIYDLKGNRDKRVQGRAARLHLGTSAGRIP